jgi:hypothetical protein
LELLELDKIVKVGNELVFFTAKRDLRRIYWQGRSRLEKLRGI